MLNTLPVIEKTEIPFVMGSKSGNDAGFFFFFSDVKIKGEIGKCQYQ